MKALEGKVAVVAGSARGAGRGIACMLGEAGATVYCTARSTRGNLVTKKRPETIDFATELRKKKIACVAVTPGFLRSEVVLETLHVTESNWRDAIKRRPEFAESETPYFVGRCIAALAADPKVMKKSGRVFNSLELAQEHETDCT